MAQSKCEDFLSQILSSDWQKQNKWEATYIFWLISFISQFLFVYSFSNLLVFIVFISVRMYSMYVCICLLTPVSCIILSFKKRFLEVLMLHTKWNVSGFPISFQTLKKDLEAEIDCWNTSLVFHEGERQKSKFVCSWT